MRMKYSLVILLLLGSASNASNFCQHDGYQEDDKCVCTPNFDGDYCEKRKCFNYGVLDSKTKSRCICPPGFLGTHCEPVKCISKGENIFGTQVDEKTYFLVTNVDVSITDDFTRRQIIAAAIAKRIHINVLMYTNPIKSLDFLQNVAYSTMGVFVKPNEGYKEFQNTVVKELTNFWNQDIGIAAVFSENVKSLPFSSDDDVYISVETTFGKHVSISLDTETVIDSDYYQLYRVNKPEMGTLSVSTDLQSSKPLIFTKDRVKSFSAFITDDLVDASFPITFTNTEYQFVSRFEYQNQILDHNQINGNVVSWAEGEIEIGKTFFNRSNCQFNIKMDAVCKDNYGAAVLNESDDLDIFTTEVVNKAIDATNHSSSDSISISKIIINALKNAEPFSDVIVVVNTKFNTSVNKTIYEEIQTKRARFFEAYFTKWAANDAIATTYVKYLVPGVNLGTFSSQLSNITLLITADVHSGLDFNAIVSVDDRKYENFDSFNNLHSFAIGSLHNSRVILRFQNSLAENITIVILGRRNSNSEKISLAFEGKNGLQNNIQFNGGSLTPVIWSNVNLAAEQLVITYADNSSSSNMVYNGSITTSDCDPSQNFTYQVDYSFECTQEDAIYYVKVGPYRTFPFTCTSIGSSKCLNGGTQLQSESCECSSHWSGPTCGVPVCQNEGENISNVCHCKPGFSGQFCEKDGDDKGERLVFSSTNGGLLNEYLKKSAVTQTTTAVPTSVTTDATEGTTSSKPLEAVSPFKAINLALDSQVADRSMIILITERDVTNIEKSTINRLAERRAEIRVFAKNSTPNIINLALVGNGIPIIGNVSDTVNMKDTSDTCLFKYFVVLPKCEEDVSAYQIQLIFDDDSRLQKQIVLTCHNSTAILTTQVSEVSTTSTSGTFSTSAAPGITTTQKLVQTTTPVQSSTTPNVITTSKPPQVRAVAFIIDVIGSSDYAFNASINTIHEYVKAFDFEHYVFLIDNFNSSFLQLGYRKYASLNELKRGTDLFYKIRIIHQEKTGVTNTLANILEKYEEQNNTLSQAVSNNIFYLTQIGLTQSDNPKDIVTQLRSFDISSTVYLKIGKTENVSISDSLKPLSTKITSINNWYDALSNLAANTANSNVKLPDKPFLSCAYGLQSNVIAGIDNSNTLGPDNKTKIENIIRGMANGFNIIFDLDNICSSPIREYYKERSAFSNFIFYDKYIYDVQFCPSNFDLQLTEFRYKTSKTAVPAYSDNQFIVFNNNLMGDCSCARSNDNTTLKFAVWFPQSAGLSKGADNFKHNYIHFVIPGYEIKKNDSDLYYKILDFNNDKTTVLDKDDYIIDISQSENDIIQELWTKFCRIGNIIDGSSTAAPPPKT
ncbi:unnamed protein product [Caenorhabditis bovis]|uniref:EGF-like domain-containing protein n=1 Tax=Caenorhabditis bovis TaxID=2654633 RepID=A0A8S1EGR2_9PELO|nr:unnamed protein product [Caenorhabditis bovis]